jgi:hypothetical protein
MIIETGLVLATGYILNSFALFVHTKLNKRTSIQAPNGIRFTYVEPEVEGVIAEPEVGLMNVKELKAYAKELGLKGYSKLNKSALQSFILGNLNV